MTGSDATHILPTDELAKIRAGVNNALKNHPNNGLLLDMARLLNHIEAVERAPDMMADVHAFMTKFNRGYDGPPRLLPKDLQEYREGHMQEELDEYTDQAALAAVLQQSGQSSTHARADMLDALVDSVYVTLQTAHAHGYDFNEAWRRVHVANMRKQLGLPTKRASDDIGKPPGWVAPDHTDLVYNAALDG